MILAGWMIAAMIVAFMVGSAMGLILSWRAGQLDETAAERMLADRDPAPWPEDGDER
jgi:hypothetical protein